MVTRQTLGGSASILDVRGRDRTNRGAAASFILPFEIVERLTLASSPRRVRPARWRHVARALLVEAAPSWQSLRTAARARMSLLAFQLEPALAVTHGLASRILIADEVGLGKTIQAGLVIAEILARTPNGRVLVVAPASLREQWQDELHTRFTIDAWVAESASLARAGAAWGAVNPWTARTVTITSIDFVKRPEVMRSLDGLVWDAVVFDEAHGLTTNSDRGIAAAAVACRARTVILLTATPHSGDDRAFASLCGIGDLDGGFPLLSFRRTRRDAGVAVSRRTTSLRVPLTLAERAMHRALQEYARKVRTERSHAADAAHLALIVLGRRACSSASSLARSVEKRMALLPPGGSPAAPQMMLPLFEPEADEEPGAELSAPGLDNRDEERRCLVHILLLARRAESAESKIQALMRLLRRANEPAIVFTEYRDTLARLAGALHELAPVILHGGLTGAERRDSLRSFTSGTARLLLATDAASEGLNLQQRCRLVINLELPWTPLRFEQRVGRVDRIGQSRRVHVVSLVAAGTAEESYVTTLLHRAGRVADSLERLQGEPVEAQRRRDMAAAEAARLRTLRVMPEPPEEPVLDGRPPVTVLRRRTDRRDVWAFRLLYFDSAAQLVWQTLVGVTRSSELDWGGSIEFVDRTAALIALDQLDDVRTRLGTLLERSMRGYLDLARRREQAIADTLQMQRARLAATLLQRNLFGRRPERAFAAQEAVLDEALGRCRARLAEIDASEDLASEPARLAFAAIRR